MSNGNEEVQPLAQPALGATIAATTTIDAIFTSLWATRSADLAGTPVYTWSLNAPWTLTATFPATTQSGQAAVMLAHFEVRPVAPSTIGP